MCAGKWVEHRKYSAVEIYDVFADEDDALVFIEHYPGVVDNPALKSLFFCIFDGICYVIWKAKVINPSSSLWKKSEKWMAARKNGPNV
ncbi:Imm6 family immunity protein [Thermoactinomyces intermedius]|uniref:Imm6 family immunity protein n=1 Tax=Thermoactinomyces intermedius TaxID=2024 RepID=UPI00314537FB